MKTLIATALIFTASCAALEGQQPDYLSLYNQVRRECGEQATYKTPPIVFVRDHAALAAMFPKLAKPGMVLRGVQWCGVIYLVQGDDALVAAHEFTHQEHGPSEKVAKAISERVVE